jgi:hypothetical protein
MPDHRRSPQLSTIEASQLSGTAGGAAHCLPPPAPHPASYGHASPCHPAPVRPAPYRGPTGCFGYPRYGFGGYRYPGFGYPGFGGRW